MQLGYSRLVENMQDLNFAELRSPPLSSRFTLTKRWNAQGTPRSLVIIILNINLRNPDVEAHSRSRSELPIERSCEFASYAQTGQYCTVSWRESACSTPSCKSALYDHRLSAVDIQVALLPNLTTDVAPLLATSRT
jgi:hypothetical protein